VSSAGFAQDYAWPNPVRAWFAAGVFALAAGCALFPRAAEAQAA